MPRIVVFRRRLLFGLTAILLLVGSVAGAVGVCAVKEKPEETKAGATERTEAAAPTTPALAPSGQEAMTVATADSFFVDFKLEREAKRDQQMELLREIAAAPATGADVRKEAQEKLMSLSRESEREARAENILRADGFKDAVVSLHEEGATVVVQGKISPEDMTTIVTFVYRGLGIPQEQVMIIGRD